MAAGVPSAIRRLAVRAAVAGSSSALAAGLTAAAAATLFARRIVTPDVARPEDVDLLAVDVSPGRAGALPGDTSAVTGSVTLRITPETVAPGRYGVWQDGGATHLRLGEVTAQDTTAGTVTRELTAVDHGTPHRGRGRWNQYYFTGTPTSALGLKHTDVLVPGQGGPLRGWLVEGNGTAAGNTWAILVHGRGATREEALRALPVLHRLGMTSLVVSYGTTAGLPEAPVGRYHLGDREWQDVESAIVFAAEHGADEVVLVGWSMGAAISLQTVSRSWTRERVRGLVLDSPVIDWRHTLTHHAKLNRVPRPVGWLGQQVLSHPQAWRLAGTEAPVDLDRLDWVTRAQELILPVLLIHSDTDDFVPAKPSQLLADARPDLVTYQDIPGAGHTKEWNVDPEVWDAAVAKFILRL